MLFNFQSNKLRKHLLIGSAVCAATLGFFGCTPDYNLDEDQPSGLNTIYGYMEDQGNYKNFLQLIDDLGEKETLSKTGSKTLFIADDDAFAKFYANNKWGVKSYDQLSLAQKKLILRSSMIDNPATISLLSSVQGPIEGECMRRTASLQTYDSVLIVSTTDPQIPRLGTELTRYWKNLAQTHDTIVLFKDFSGAAPMIHFLPRFLEQNMITGEDVDFLYNDPKGTHVSDDAYVNDCKVVEANIFCKNGFLHKVDKVMLPLDNMAELIRVRPQLSIYSSLLERFAAPFYSYAITREYNRIYKTDVDSVYQKSYFAMRGSESNGIESTSRNQDKDELYSLLDTELLKFDPGWNRYSPGTLNDRDRDEVMEDMGCMLAPTDAALTDWWNNGGGKVLKDNFGTWDNVPDRVIVELIKNNQLYSLVGSVPSKFKSVLNDAAMEMGITTADVDSVFLACNGAVYQTNKVFSPMSYSSVLFPAVVSDNLQIIYNAISLLEFPAYLNSMVSRYSFFIPVNEGMLTYVDPVSLPQQETTIWKFKMNPNPSATGKAAIQAVVYKAVRQADGTWLQTDSLTTYTGGSSNTNYYGASNTATKGDYVFDRLEDLLDNIIVIGDVEEGKSYYMTKGKNFVKVGGTINVPGQMTVAGGFQLEQGQPLTVSSVYNMENGKSYIVDVPVYTAHKSVSDILAERAAEDGEFSEFYELLRECGALATSTGSKIKWSSTSKNGNLIYIPEEADESVNYLLNTYHYTIYAPTNDAMAEARKKGLPTMEMLDEAIAIDEDDSTKIVVPTDPNENPMLYTLIRHHFIDATPGDSLAFDSLHKTAARVRKVMLDFVKYHIQDNAIFFDKVNESGEFASGRYETAKTNPSTGRSFRLTVDNDEDSLRVTGICTPKQAINMKKMCNQMVREYWLNNANVNDATMIETSSSVVLHAIDRPLLYKYKEGADLTLPENNQFIYSPFEVYDPGEEEAAAETKRRRK
ncbi:MAG: fasciclin domain-containing protein [Bacteroidaceae bacterium]|nr:fasciclin domain-containing protein [Bacteroidaceae bacterium]